MHDMEQLVEQHIREYESRQKHIDELLQRAKKHAQEKPELHDDLTQIQDRHEQMVSNMQEFKEGRIDEQAVQAIEQAGPMGVWFGLISELETLIEELEK